jgi:hypothetical protein
MTDTHLRPATNFPLLSLIIFRQLRVCWCRAPSLTRSRVCGFQFLLGIASAAFLRSESHGTHEQTMLKKLKLKLKLTYKGQSVGQSVLVSGSSHLEPMTRFLFSVWQLRVSCCGAPSLTRGTGWPSYTPGHWVPFSSPLTTRRATVEVFKFKLHCDRRSVGQFALVSGPPFSFSLFDKCNMEFGFQLSTCSGTKEKMDVLKLKLSCDRQSVCQSLLVSSSHLELMTRFSFCPKIARFFMFGILSDEMIGLQFPRTTASGPCQSKSLSGLSPAELQTWRARSPYLYPPRTGWPSYTPRHFRRLLRLAGL